MSDARRDALTRNGVWLVLPPLVVGLALWGMLPPAYGNSAFAAAVPGWWSAGENGLRILVFAIPGTLVFGASSSLQRVGWILYAAGILAYVASFAALGWWPRGPWSSSVVGLTAPAWTPAVWMLGIAMVCRQSWLFGRFRWCDGWLYLVPVAAFLFLHVGHAMRAIEG